MSLTKQELERLQKLCCISLDPAEQEKFLSQLENIIGFLGTMKGAETPKGSDQEAEHTLLPRGGVHAYPESAALLKNVKHPQINNCIVIKSVLEN